MAVTTIFSDCLEIIQSATSSEDLLHKYHVHYQRKIFKYFNDRYLGELKAWWATYTLPVETDRSIVLYETRCHENLEFLIYNLTYFARGWGLVIYCSKENHNYITNILKHNRFRATLHIVRDDEGGREVRDEYNEFVKSTVFWNSLPYKYVLMCEMDAYLRKSITNDIENYDYICAIWPWHPELSGGGGISIRNVKSMQKICEKFPALTAEIPAQDFWVAKGCSNLQMSYNNRYFVEADHYNDDPSGFHNWWTFISPEKLVKLYNIYEKYLTLELT